MTRLERQAIAAVIRSLETEPEMWRHEGSRVTHRCHLTSVWIANSYFGLHVEVYGERIGGVTLASPIFGPLIPWRRKMYRAAIRYRPVCETREGKLASALQLFNRIQKDKQ